MSTTQLFYNNQEILPNQGTPFVGRQDTFVNYGGGDRWAERTTLSLHGQITGACVVSGIVNAQNQLINIFNKDFQTFEIKESGQTIFSAPYAFVKNIDFPSNNYAYILNYIVTLDCYQQNLFSGVYGVLDPVDEWAYEEKLDYTVNLSHTISARGFNTSSGAANGLENAKAFVLSRTGVSGIVAPAFIQAKQGSLIFCLKDLHERIDRFNGTYAVTETYRADAYYGMDGLLRYTTDFNCDTLEGISKLTVQGEIEGCNRFSDMTSLRQRYSGINIGALAQSDYLAAGGIGTLNTGFISQSLTEDSFSKKLTFNSVYDNNPDPLTYADYSINIEVSEQEITTVSFQGVIKGRGDINTRWTNVQNFYQTFDPVSLAFAAYTTFSPSAIYPLNVEPLSDSVTFNQFAAEISINKSWDNRDIPPGGFKTFSYTLHFSPSLEKVTFTPLANLCATQYYVVDLGYTTRSNFSIDGRGKICPPNTLSAGIFYIKQLANNSLGTYSSINKATLDENQLTTSTQQEINFRFGWSAQPISSITVPGSYSTISSLSIK